MWPFLTSLSSGIWRCSLLALLALAFCFGSSSALATCYTWAATGNWGGSGYLDPSTAAQAAMAYCNSNPGQGPCNEGWAGQEHSYQLVSVQVQSGNAFPQYTFNWTYLDGNGNSHSMGPTVITPTAAAQCPSCPSAGQHTYYELDAIDGSGMSCHAGCQYTTPAPALVVRGNGGSLPSDGIVESTSTGQPCGQTASTVGPGGSPDDSANENPQQCDASGSVCAVDNPSTGQNCGEFNGDQVCVHSINPGTCVGYQSGGVACVAASGGAVTSPPAPGVSGTPATPSGTVASEGQTVNYYSSSVVSSSASSTGGTAGVQSNPSNGAPLSGSGGGSVSVSGTVQVAGSVSVVPNAANGDCGASGVNCAPGSSPTTGFSGDCTDFASCTENFYSAVAGAPIVAGAVAMESSWPAGSCDIGSVSLATFNNQSFNYGTQACEVWNDYMSAPLGAILLVVYACAGVFIILSA